MNANEAMAAAIAVATIVTVLWRPLGLNEGIWAFAGGLLMIVSGSISFDATLDVLDDLLGVFVFLIGLFWLTLAARRAGLFDRAAVLSVRASGGDGRRLLAAVFVLGALTTAVLSNDATVVLVTPVILVACQVLELPPLPYLFACTFVADTASSMLPISNPINLLYAQRFDISFQRHALFLVVPTLLAIAMNAWIFHLLFRSSLPRRFDPKPLLDRATDPLGRLERIVAWGLAGVAVAYVGAAIVGIEPYWITLAGGATLAAVGLASRRVAPPDLIRVQPVTLYALIIGLAVVVAGGDRAGLLDLLGRAVTRATYSGGLAGLLGLALGTAFGTNLVNNWTMALAVIPPLEQAKAGQVFTLGSMLGADIGPNFTIVGSLATLLWLSEVRRAGLVVSGRTYLKLGLIATAPALVVATIALYLLHLVL